MKLVDYYIVKRCADRAVDWMGMEIIVSVWNMALYYLYYLDRLTIDPVVFANVFSVSRGPTWNARAFWIPNFFLFPRNPVFKNYRFWETTGGTSMPFYGVMTHFSFSKNWPSLAVVAKVIFTIFAKARLVFRDTPDMLWYTMCLITATNELYQWLLLTMFHACPKKTSVVKENDLGLSNQTAF